MSNVYAIRYQGHLLAKELAARGLQTTVITDSAVFAMISRVNMVLESLGFVSALESFAVNFSKFKLAFDLTLYRL